MFIKKIKHGLEIIFIVKSNLQINLIWKYLLYIVYTCNIVLMGVENSKLIK